MRSYKLPDGTETRDKDTYLYIWRNLADKVAKHFPGYFVGGFNPGVLLHSTDEKGGSVSLPTRACFALVGK